MARSAQTRSDCLRLSLYHPVPVFHVYSVFYQQQNELHHSFQPHLDRAVKAKENMRD